MQPTVQPPEQPVALSKKMLSAIVNQCISEVEAQQPDENADMIWVEKNFNVDGKQKTVRVERIIARGDAGSINESGIVVIVDGRVQSLSADDGIARRYLERQKNLGIRLLYRGYSAQIIACLLQHGQYTAALENLSGQALQPMLRRFALSLVTLERWINNYQLLSKKQEQAQRLLEEFNTFTQQLPERIRNLPLVTAFRQQLEYLQQDEKSASAYLAVVLSGQPQRFEMVDYTGGVLQLSEFLYLCSIAMVDLIAESHADNEAACLRQLRENLATTAKKHPDAPVPSSQLDYVTRVAAGTLMDAEGNTQKGSAKLVIARDPSIVQASVFLECIAGQTILEGSFGQLVLLKLLQLGVATLGSLSDIFTFIFHLEKWLGAYPSEAIRDGITALKLPTAYLPEQSQLATAIPTTSAALCRYLSRWYTFDELRQLLSNAGTAVLGLVSVPIYSVNTAYQHWAADRAQIDLKHLIERVPLPVLKKRLSSFQAELNEKLDELQHIWGEGLVGESDKETIKIFLEYVKKEIAQINSGTQLSGISDIEQRKHFSIMMIQVTRFSKLVSMIMMQIAHDGLLHVIPWENQHLDGFMGFPKHVLEEMEAFLLNNALVNHPVASCMALLLAGLGACDLPGFNSMSNFFNQILSGKSLAHSGPLARSIMTFVAFKIYYIAFTVHERKASVWFELLDVFSQHPVELGVAVAALYAVAWLQVTGGYYAYGLDVVGCKLGLKNSVVIFIFQKALAELVEADNLAWFKLPEFAFIAFKQIPFFASFFQKHQQFTHYPQSDEQWGKFLKALSEFLIANGIIPDLSESAAQVKQEVTFSTRLAQNHQDAAASGDVVNDRPLAAESSSDSLPPRSSPMMKLETPLYPDFAIKYKQSEPEDCLEKLVREVTERQCMLILRCLIPINEPDPLSGQTSMESYGYKILYVDSKGEIQELTASPELASKIEKLSLKFPAHKEKLLDVATNVGHQSLQQAIIDHVRCHGAQTPTPVFSIVTQIELLRWLAPYLTTGDKAGWFMGMQNLIARMGIDDESKSIFLAMIFQLQAGARVLLPKQITNLLIVMAAATISLFTDIRKLHALTKASWDFLKSLVWWMIKMVAHGFGFNAMIHAGHVNVLQPGEEMLSVWDCFANATNTQGNHHVVSLCAHQISHCGFPPLGDIEPGVTRPEVYALRAVIAIYFMAYMVQLFSQIFSAPDGNTAARVALAYAEIMRDVNDAIAGMALKIIAGMIEYLAKMCDYVILIGQFCNPCRIVSQAPLLDGEAESSTPPSVETTGAWARASKFLVQCNRCAVGFFNGGKPLQNNPLGTHGANLEMPDFGFRQ